MHVVCLGGQFHEAAFDLSSEQDVFHPTPLLRPRYVKRYQTADRMRAYFASSDLTDTDAKELLARYIKEKSALDAGPAAHA
ncbi:MAG: hypothetical protein JWP47_3 [Polaromonas sp.]|nr:hypothetical protein [Polaromonas sp.]